MRARWRTRVGWGGVPASASDVGGAAGGAGAARGAGGTVHTRTRYINVVRAVLRQDGVRVPSGGAATFA
jgi:hypothetical protein